MQNAKIKTVITGMNNIPTLIFSSAKERNIFFHLSFLFGSPTASAPT
jgi:hypothetical protein